MAAAAGTIGQVRPGTREVPASALLVSILALLVPLAATFVVPEAHVEDAGLLVMLPALIPPFLLSYHKGWAGGTRALAAGMATLALVQVEVGALDIDAPSPFLVLAVILILTGVSLGSGWVSELLLREREAAIALALVDPLTRLPNRRHLHDTLERNWARAIRGAPLSVVIFDLDHFKRVNDTYGHAVGDQVLQAFGDILSERTRRMDLSGRWGGEEFLTVLIDCTEEGARGFAEAVRRRLEEASLPCDEVTVSAGVASLDEGMSAPDILIAAADQALYQAKLGGRNRVMVAPRAGARRNLPAPAAVEASARHLPEGTRVLVVDDDDGMRRALSTMLKRLGCSTVQAPGGLAAVDHLRDDPDFDLLVTDVIMPGMSGFALADVVSRIRPDLPVLYISGYPQSDVYWGGTPGMRSSFIEKPVDMNRLEHELLRLILDGGDESNGPVPETGVEDATRSESTPHHGVRRHAADTPEARHRARFRPGQVDLATARILLVDDNPAALAALVRVLEREGYASVEHTTDPRVAARRIASEDFDLLITDLHMPELDGFELLGKVAARRSRDRFLPALVLTGDSDLDSRRRALSLGASDFLTKPFDEFEAHTRVHNLLQLRSFFQGLADERDRLEWLVRERTTELVDSQSEMAHRLAIAAEYRDDMTGRHASRVGLLASHIASELGLPARDVDRIRRAAPLHDVGKIGIPDHILRKSSRLTEEEYETIRAHTRIGARILGRARCDLLKTASEIALRHHENWDGSGYPDGVSGEDIPLAARITAVADTFDVISHRRPYKDAASSVDARSEVVRCAGSQFDPTVVAALERVLDNADEVGVTRLADPIDPGSDIGSPGDPPSDPPELQEVSR